MKRLKLVLLLLCTFHYTLAQNAYYDALMFYDLKMNNANVISPKFSNPTLINSFLNNPFDQTITAQLKDYLPVLRNEYIIQAASGFATKLNGLPGLALSKGGISPSYQSMIIDAVAKVVAEDFQEGLNVVYINKFKKKLDGIAELRAFFPATYKFFQDTNPFDYPKLGRDFKAKFEEDLKSLVLNVKRFIDDTQSAPWSTFKTSPYYLPYCVASDIGGKLIAGSHPVEILDYLELQYDLKRKTDNRFDPYYKTVRLLNIVQLNFQKGKDKNPSPFSTQFENVWIQYKDLKLLADAPEKIWYLMGLIYQQDPVVFKSLMPATTQAAIEKLYNDTILPSIDLLMNIDNAIGKKNLSGEDMGQMLTSVLTIMQNYNKVSGLIIDHNQLIVVSQKLIQCYTAISEKDYNSLVSNVVFILDQINRDFNKNQQTADVLKVTALLMKYGTFITDVVNAKNSDDLASAYRKAAVNRGTYIDKRFSISSLTISAHPGGIVGLEQLSGNDEWKFNVGITAPIGFEFTWGSKTKYDTTKKTANYTDGSAIKTLKGSSNGFMVSFADIGAVFNYRLNDKDSELPQELTFKQIFSPGIAFHHGFKNSPITFGVGIQYTPELRKVEEEAVTIEANSFKAFLRLTYDLPLLKIYYKKEK
ncbi:hypothetical protein [Chryseolinea lacunae]|uniref:Outer membrane protein beta-barrel domain-containing protein n=1 Tax=Chryseolinea lacunae TaxID=2801331 RepID=A0ABS1L322_9BACT|nr:hypothetical protein [Chryseolinea lacunae]MBL0745943.1 hypothetical protein [Chryseolinea lacunae]